MQIPDLVKQVEKFLAVIWTAIAALVLFPGSLNAQCRLCASDSALASPASKTAADREIPLRIEITANLNFSRLALMDRSGGEIRIDPMTGHKRISGNIADLGGMSLHGEGRLQGEPGRYVRVQLPERISLSAPNGSTAELVKLKTNLPAQSRLDQQGQLTFTFGGSLKVSGDTAGQFRGRIAITADYE